MVLVATGMTGGVQRACCVGKGTTYAKNEILYKNKHIIEPLRKVTLRKIGVRNPFGWAEGVNRLFLIISGSAQMFVTLVVEDRRVLGTAPDVLACPSTCSSTPSCFYCMV